MPKYGRRCLLWPWIIWPISLSLLLVNTLQYGIFLPCIYNFAFADYCYSTVLCFTVNITLLLKRANDKYNHIWTGGNTGAVMAASVFMTMRILWPKWSGPKVVILSGVYCISKPDLCFCHGWLHMFLFLCILNLLGLKHFYSNVVSSDKCQKKRFWVVDFTGTF